MNRLWSLMAAGLALAAAAAALPAAAQSYPSKAIRLVSPFPPGGSVDVVGRLLAAKLSESMGQQMVVDNRSGASGVIGTEVVMNSPPDGYTLLINTIPFVSNQFLMPRAPYDPLRDFVSISLVASSPSFVTVHPSLPVRSIQELIALAKSKPGQLYYSAAGVGTNPHIAGELFNLLADVNIVAVQFKGGGPADTAVIAGDVAVTFGNISQEIGYVKAGRMRALAVTSAKRNPAMPELPTVAEAPGRSTARLRVRYLVRRRGAQGHAARDCRHAEFAHPQGAHRPRPGEVLRGAGADGHREHARGGRRAPGKGAEEVGARHQGARHQGGVRCSTA